MEESDKKPTEAPKTMNDEARQSKNDKQFIKDLKDECRRGRGKREGRGRQEKGEKIIRIAFRPFTR